MIDNYEIVYEGGGYKLLLDGKVVFNQTEIIPYPAPTIKESAEIHISNINTTEPSELERRVQELEDIIMMLTM